jgi:hypothetical protein
MGLSCRSCVEGGLVMHCQLFWMCCGRIIELRFVILALLKAMKWSDQHETNFEIKIEQGTETSASWFSREFSGFGRGLFHREFERSSVMG